MKPNVARFIRGVKTSMIKHSPEILTGVGIVGMVSTTVLAVQATPKALRLIKQAEKEKGEELAKFEVIKTTWKCYVPATVTGTVAIGCLVGASSVNARRNAALATAYALSETALHEYRDKVVETIGEKKEQVVRDKVAEERIKKNPASQNTVLVSSKGGTTRCYDYMTDRYFDGDIDVIKKGLNRFNAMLLREDYASLNDFYDEIGLAHAGLGDDFGWNVGRLGRDLVELAISYQGDEDDNPCAVIAFDPMPVPNYISYV